MDLNYLLVVNIQFISMSNEAVIQYIHPMLNSSTFMRCGMSPEDSCISFGLPQLSYDCGFNRNRK